MSTPQTLETPLQVVSTQEIAQKVHHEVATTTQTLQKNPEVEAKADDLLRRILELDPSRTEARELGKASAETYGLELQKEAARQSRMLQQPVKQMSERGAEGGEVANALVNLKTEVESLDPARFNFEAGWLSRTLGFLPGIGTPIKKYFSQFESAQTVISAIVASLEKGRDQLSRDNVMLAEDQSHMRELTLKLEKGIEIARRIDEKLSHRLEREIEKGSEQFKFLSEEVLFPLRQRVLDLQQQLVVNQQGVIALELIQRNNLELMRGVNRALNVTVSALHVGATVALALANQKIVLDKLQAVNKTTNELIAGTASRLKTQGVEIQKQATSTQLDMNVLKASFADLKAAMDDLSNFRQNALPQMAQSVLELDRISTDANQVIAKMDEGNRKRPTLEVKID
jgi:uncharacterized protein YaaN involved in tellurite resistance